MKEELNKKLVQKFPLLYEEYFVFEIADGWYNLIYEFSSELEILVKKFIQENPELNCLCGEPRKKHINNSGKCFIVYKIPYFANKEFFRKLRKGIPQTIDTTTKKLKNKSRIQAFIIRNIYWKFNKIVNNNIHKFFKFLCDKKILYKKRPSNCKNFKLNSPKALQIKQKFGLLRIYLTYETKEISSLIKKYERKSSKICEKCGDVGKKRNKSWIITLCDKCEQERSKQK